MTRPLPARASGLRREEARIVHECDESGFAIAETKVVLDVFRSMTPFGLALYLRCACGRARVAGQEELFQALFGALLLATAEAVKP